MHLVKRYFLLLILLVFPLVACDDGNSDNKNKDPYGFDVSGVKVELPKVVAVVDTDKTSGITGDTFNFSSRITYENENITGYSWVLPENASASGQLDATSVSVTFDAPGDYEIALKITYATGEIVTGTVIHIFDASAVTVIGNLSGGNTPTSQDADLLEEYLAGNTSLTPDQISAADINLDGKINEEDITLIRNAAANNAGAPEYISKKLASAGDSVFIINPLLLNPSFDIDVKLNVKTQGSWDNECLSRIEGKIHTDTVFITRTKAGYAVFSIPMKYVCLESPEIVEILLVNKKNPSEEKILNDNFEILPLPQVQGEPGSRTVEAMGRLRKAIELMPVVLENYTETLSVEGDEQSTLVGMAKAATEEYNEIYAQFYVAFESLDDQTKEAWDRLAYAYGLSDEVLVDLRNITEELTKSAFHNYKISESDSELLINLICSFKQIADISSGIAAINEKISAVLDYLDWFPINKLPYVGRIIKYLSEASSKIDMVTGLIDIIAKFVPELGKLELKSTPASVNVGASAELKAFLQIKIVSGLCKTAGGQVLESLTDAIKGYITRIIASKIPVANKIFKKARYKVEKMNFVVSKVYKAIGELVGKVLDETGISDYLQSLVDSFCDSFSDPNIPVSASVNSGCGNINDNKWMCTENCAGSSVTMSVSKDVCGKEKTASLSVDCNGGICGNGTVEAGEECEIDNDCAAGKKCNSTCNCVDPDVCGNGILEAGEECEKDSDCTSGECGISTCTCAPSGGQCGCDCDADYNCTPKTDGTTFTIVSGCDGFEEATECNGWFSIADMSGNDGTALYDDGTEMTYNGCTVKIHCP